jgi:preprotein translocase subunit SecF
VLSILVTVASIALVFTRGLNLGIDFVGGQSVRVTFSQPPQLDNLRDRIDEVVGGGASLQESGGSNVILIRTPLPQGGEAAASRAATAIRGAIQQLHPDARFDAVETVSGKVSKELFQSGALAIALAMLGIAIYIWIRFEWQFGIGALVTLFHDVWMTLGFFSITQLEFNLNVVAAILTIVGYSLNDTVVIYDRIRENLRKYRKMDIVPLLNLSLNETLSRTMVTSLSILFALFALLILGPEVIFGLTIAIFIGIFVGTYSSIYISSPILVWLRVTSGSFLPRDPMSRAGGAPRNESYGARV